MNDIPSELNPWEEDHTERRREWRNMLLGNAEQQLKKCLMSVDVKVLPSTGSNQPRLNVTWKDTTPSIGSQLDGIEIEIRYALGTLLRDLQNARSRTRRRLNSLHVPCPNLPIPSVEQAPWLKVARNTENLLHPQPQTGHYYPTALESRAQNFDPPVPRELPPQDSQELDVWLEVRRAFGYRRTPYIENADLISAEEPAVLGSTSDKPLDLTDL